jgi:type II secretory pathway pseudopilin PulG
MITNQQHTTHNVQQEAAKHGWRLPSVVSRLLWVVGQRKTRVLPGFTLIETFVAVVILATALAGALSLASQGFNSADVAGDQVTASFLAQDALEYVRYARDTTCLGNQGSVCGASWLGQSLGNCVTNASIQADPSAWNYCTIDTTLGLTAANPSPCDGPNNTCSRMRFNSSTGLYNYASGSESKFTRYITIFSPVGGNSDEAKIVVQVYWLTKGGYPRTPITLEQDIYNWQ